jgi:hypothetical protein
LDCAAPLGRFSGWTGCGANPLAPIWSRRATRYRWGSAELATPLELLEQLAGLVPPPRILRHVGIRTGPHPSPPLALPLRPRSTSISPSPTSGRADRETRTSQPPSTPQRPSSYPSGSSSPRAQATPLPDPSWPIPESPSYLPLTREKGGWISYP